MNQTWRKWRPILVNVAVVALIAIVGGALLGKYTIVGGLFIGLATSLLAWTLTSSVARALDDLPEQHDALTREIRDALTGKGGPFESHDAKTTRILDVVTGQSIALVRHNRKGVTAYIEPCLETASRVKISGRALSTFTSEFFTTRTHPLLVRAKKAPVRVELLILDPASDVAKRLETRERGTIATIKHVLGEIDKFRDDGDKPTLARGAQIELRMTAEPLNTTLTFVQGDHDSILLMGMLYNGIIGFDSQIYQVLPNPSAPGVEPFGLHHNCLLNFDHTYSGAKTVYQWAEPSV